MPYAPEHRRYYDADSHIMELPDFLKAYADPGIRDQIPEVNYSASLVTDEEVAVIVGQGSRHSREHVQAQIELGDNLIRTSKEIQALGAFNSSDRSTALDMLGFEKQLVFATHSVVLPFHPSSKTSPELRYGAARAHNRHMADFCQSDDRLMGVAVVPLDDPQAAILEVDSILESGLEAVWVPHRAPIGMSPGHTDLEGSGPVLPRRVFPSFYMWAGPRFNRSRLGATMAALQSRIGWVVVRTCAQRMLRSYTNHPRRS